MSIQSAHRSNDENTRPHSGAASSREADLGSAPIGSLLFKLALPAIAAQIINVLYNMVDRMYIGHIPDIGPSALTGVGVTMPIIMCISAFCRARRHGRCPAGVDPDGKKAIRILLKRYSATVPSC